MLALCRFIYGMIKTFLCSERVVHVHYVAIDDLVITTPLKKNDITALWSCSGRAGASLLGQDVVASLLSLCMAKWLRKWRRGWLYVRSNKKNAKSLFTKSIIYSCSKTRLKQVIVGTNLTDLQGLETRQTWLKWHILTTKSMILSLI